MNTKAPAPGWRRRIKAALVGGGLLGLSGGALSESGLLPTAVSVGTGAGFGVVLGVLVPDRMLDARPRDGEARVVPDDVRETRYWRGCMPVFSAFFVFLALFQMVTGRWIMGLLMGYCVMMSFVVPEWRYRRYLEHGGDPGPPMPARRITVGRRTFGPGAIVFGGMAITTVVGLVIGGFLGALT